VGAGSYGEDMSITALVFLVGVKAGLNKVPAVRSA
jgi:hypothetical protein